LIIWGCRDVSPGTAVSPMASYEHLPIYKTPMDLTVYPEQAAWNFSRYYKYRLGSDLRQQR